MSTWLIVWLALTLVSLVVLAAVAVGVVRQALVVSRSAGRFREEVAPLADSVTREGERAADRGSKLGPPSRT